MNRSYRIAVVVAALVLTFAGGLSWPRLSPACCPSDGNANTAGGTSALENNTLGCCNTAFGIEVLRSNTTGNQNTAFGVNVLWNNTIGNNNTGFGIGTLSGNTTGNDNTAVGISALGRTTTSNNNIAVGANAGGNLTSGSNNIYLGHGGVGSESGTIRIGTPTQQTRVLIAGIAGSHVSGSQVVINSKGRLGVVSSSARYKRDIHPMGERSQGLFQLRPVTFRYKQDPLGQRQYGLIAEEVAKVYPELVTKGPDGKVESVQYHELIPMLLNEVQHQQQEISELKGQAQQVATQSQELAELRAQNERLQAVLVEHNAALAARLEQLEHAPHGATVAAR
jgi:Chaperone of endosialidase